MVLRDVRLDDGDFVFKVPREQREPQLVTWDRRYRVGWLPHASAIATTTDGVFLVAVTSQEGNWLLKVDRGGRELWRYTYDGTYLFNAIAATADGFLLAGSTRSEGAGDQNGWLLRSTVTAASYGTESTEVRTTTVLPRLPQRAVAATSSPARYGAMVRATPTAVGSLRSTVTAARSGTAFMKVWTTAALPRLPQRPMAASSSPARYGPAQWGEGTQYDGWLLKVDRDGRELWRETYGGAYSDRISRDRRHGSWGLSPRR